MLLETLPALEALVIAAAAEDAALLVAVAVGPASVEYRRAPRFWTRSPTGPGLVSQLISALTGA